MSKTSQHDESTMQFGESHHNIETKKFPGHTHYVGYGDGTWHIHKHPKGWRATHQGNGKGGANHGTFVKSSLKEVSGLLESHAAKASSQHDETEQFDEQSEMNGAAKNRGFKLHRVYTGHQHRWKNGEHTVDTFHTGEWKHFKSGQAIASGKGKESLHEHLANHLGSSSQHDEANESTPQDQGNGPIIRRASPPLGPPNMMVERAEQFDEEDDSIVKTLKKHKFKLHSTEGGAKYYHKTLPGGFGSTPDHHIVTTDKLGWHHTGPKDSRGGGTYGKGADKLHEHLTKHASE